MLITLIIVSAILFVSLYANINSYKKIEVLEKQIDRIESIESNSVALVENLLIAYIKVLSKLKRIDRLGSFESDDEVGFVFKTIKNTIEELKTELDNLKKALKNEEIGTNDVD
jgi:uncharacterized protein involved in tolerance to divalent cations